MRLIKIICRLPVLTAILILLLNGTSFSGKPKKVKINIAGKTYTLLTASTFSERQKGLSGISKLEKADGMIFYFNSPQSTAFWNKDTHLDLELIWLLKGKVVGRNTLPSEDNAGLINLKSPGEVDSVVELVRYIDP